MSNPRSSAKTSDMERPKGFTLIEVMVVLAVVVIVVTIGIPGFRELIQNNRVATQANEFIGAHKAARSEAIKRGKSVTVCSSTTGTGCANSTDWATGWILFVDEDSDGTVDVGDTLVRVWDALRGGSTLTGNVNFVRYTASGLANAAATFNLRIADCRGDQERDIAFSATGSVVVTKVTCS